MKKLTAILLLVVVAGCRGETSRQPPIHIVQNMDFQQKLKAQSESKFEGWKDHRGMRLPVRDTIAQGSLGALHPDSEVAKFYVFKNADGSYVTTNPLAKSRAVLERGRERFAINCSVCHGLNGRGLGIVGRKLGLTKPPSFVKPAKDDGDTIRYKPEVLGYSDGEFFDIITNGRSTMQPYRFQVGVKDRWAIIHYLRALQLRASN